MKNYKKTKTMPTSGQFVAMWEFDGKIWCDTFKYSSGILVKYDTNSDCFIEAGDDLSLKNGSIIFFILKEKKQKPKKTSIYNDSTAITCTNNAELQYVLAWCESKEKITCEWVHNHDFNNTDINLIINNRIVTRELSGNLIINYISFNDFLKEISKEK